MTISNYEFTEHSILTREEEVELFKLYEASKKVEVRNYIVNHNLRFAISSAHCFARKYHYVDQRDLNQYAMLGLMSAVEKFNWRLGRRFITLASFEIKNAININVENYESMIRLPSDHCRRMQKAVKFNGLSDEMEIGYHNLLGSSSIDVKNSDGEYISDIIPDNQQETLSEVIETNDFNKKLYDIINKELNEDERKLIAAIYGLNEGAMIQMSDIASELNCNAQYIRNVRERTLKKLRSSTEKLVRA